MPNGIDKNWYRMCAAINGFRVRYGSWPIIIHLPEGALKNLFAEETFAKLKEKLAFIYDDAPFIAEDDMGRRYNLGQEGFSDEPPDIPAHEWLDVEPDSEVVKEYYAPRNSSGKDGKEKDRKIDSKPLPIGCSIGLPLLFGGLVAVPGMLLILTGLNIIDIYPEFKDGPRWVFSILGLPFFSWGVWIASRAFEGKEGENSITAQVARHFLILANLIPMAGIFLWGGFGPGKRNFQVETTFDSYSVTSTGDELVGRFIYGGVGIFMAMLAALYIDNHFVRMNKR